MTLGQGDSIVELNEAMLMESVNAAVQNTITEVISFLPGLIAAILVFLLGWIIAILASRLVAGLFRAIKLEDALKHHKVEDALGTVKISDVLTRIVKYYVLLIFLQEAVSLVALGSITAFLAMVLLYAPLLIGGFLVFLVAVILGEYLKEMIIELSKSPFVRFTGRIVKLILVYVGVTMGLATAGFDTTLITGVFMTILQAMVFGIALAIGVAFGLGGQEDAKNIIKTGRKHFKV